jgi:hypothetical protein
MKLIRYLNVSVLIFVVVDFVVIVVIDVVVVAVVVVWPEWQLMLDIWRQPRQLTLPFTKLIRYLNVIVFIFVVVVFLLLLLLKLLLLLSCRNGSQCSTSGDS